MKEVALISEGGACYDRKNHKTNPFIYHGIEIDCLPPKGAGKVFTMLQKGTGFELTHDDGESAILANWLYDVLKGVGVDVVRQPHRLIVIGESVDLTEI